MEQNPAATWPTVSYLLTSGFTYLLSHIICVLAFRDTMAELREIHPSGSAVHEVGCFISCLKTHQSTHIHQSVILTASYGVVWGLQAPWTGR